MDNSQIIEEIDIIIRAKIEEARKDIQNVAKETKKMVSSVSNDMKKLDKSGQLDGFKQELKQCKEEIQKVKINDGNWNITYTLGADTSEFDKAMNEAQKKYEQQLKEAQEIQASVPIQSIKDNQQEEVQISPLQENLNNFNYLPIKQELQTIAMQIAELVPQIQTFGAEAKKVFTEQDRLIPQVAQRIKEFGVGVSYIKGQITQPFDALKQRISPISSIFSNIGKVAKNSVIQASANFKELANSTNNPIGKLNNLIKKIRNTGDEAQKTKTKGKGIGTDFGKSLEKGISSIKKFTLSLLSVRSAFSVISKAAQSYLSFDTQLNDSLQNSWNTLGSLLAPILEYVVGLFSKLTSAVATFVKTLTGVDLVARANAKALDKQSKSAKKASQSLSGIDDIDTLSTNSGNGSDDTQTISMEEINIEPLMLFANKVQEIFSKLFNPFKEAWENVGTDVFDSMMSMFNSIGELSNTVFSSFEEVWTNGTGTEIMTNMLLNWQQLFDIVDSVAGAITGAWENNNNGTEIVQHIADIFKDIQQFSLDIGDSLKKWIISEDFQIMLEKVFGVVEDLFGYAKDFADWILKMYETYLKPVIDEKLLPAITSIITAITDIWNTVKPVVDFVIGYIGSVLEPVIQGLCGFIGGIIDVIKGIADFISGVFTGDWKKAWNGIKLIFKGIWDAIASIVKTPINMILSGVEFLVNKIIDAFNSFKKAINKISFDVPDWIPVIGGKKWGFNLKLSDSVSLPRLATGNVAYEPTTAIFGEYANARSNPEITSPISIMKDSFRDVLNEFDFGGTRVEKLVINVADENFYDGAIDYINEKNARKGVSVIKEV